MSLKTLINLLKFTDLAKIYKKFLNYFSILTIVLGATFGTFNSAYAADGDVFSFGGAGAGVDEITDATLDDTGARALSDGDGALIIDEAGKIDTAVAITVDTITVVDDNNADSLVIETGALTFTVEETITNAAGDTLLITLDDEAAGTLDLQGAVTGVAENDIDFVAEITTTIELSGDVVYSANFDGDGTLKVTGAATVDEQIGATADMGILDIDSTLTVTAATVQVDVLDLDGTIAGTATTLTVDEASTFNGDITTDGLVTITAAATLDGDTTIETTGDADADDILFSNTINGANNLTLTAGDGVASDITLTGIVGGTTDVSSLTMSGHVITTAAVNSDGAISVTNAGASTMAALGGTGSLIKAGAEKLTLSGVNTLAGDVTISAGTLEVDATLADTTNVSVATGAIYDVDAADTIASVSGAGNIQLGANLTTGDAGDDTLSGIISGTGDLIKVGAGNLTISGTNTTTGKLDINVGTVTLSGSLDGAIDVADDAIIIITKDIVADAVVSVTANDGTVAAGATIHIPVNLSAGQKIVWSDGADNAAQITAIEAAIVDTALFDYVASDAGDDTHITATAKTAATTASELSVTNNMAIALKQAHLAAINDTLADDNAEEAFEDALNNSAGTFTATEDTTLAKQVAPQTDMISGSSVAAQAVTGSVQGIMSSRMASLRSGDAYFGTGVAAGGMSAQSGFIQVFGSTAEQNNKTVGSGTQYGYESDTEGLAIGFDGVTDDGMTIGVSLATANTDVDGKGTGKSTNSIDTYSASLYMDRATDAGYVEGSVTFGLNENSTSRKVNTAGLDRTYTGSYDSQSLSVNISAGAPNEVGNGYLTPFGSFTASFMDIDAYTEKSTVANDALRLKVAQDDVNSMIGTVGIKYHAEMGNGGTPMISLAINNEFGDATIDSVNTYQGGGTAFKTSTAVEELSASLGLGYSYGSDAASIELAYEADVNDDEYLSHYGSIKVVGKF